MAANLDYINENGLFKIDPYVHFEIGSPFITLNGRFHLEEMEKIVKYMQKNRVKYITNEH